MKVLCVRSNFRELDDRSAIERLEKYLRVSDGELPVKQGECYTVYGILFRDDSPWYFLCQSEHDESPTPYPAELFQTIDERLSSCWRLCSRVIRGRRVSSALVFSEWATNPDFFEDLTDGSPEAVSLFMNYKAAMDMEFSQEPDR